jgi:predicted DNA-binding transcriptional regulator YafY
VSQDRVLGLLELLQAHHSLTGPEIARMLRVDERTVRRYAQRLVELGIPVEGRRGRYGGYRLLPGYRLPPLMLTDDEAVAVVLGLLAGERLGLSTGDTALAKIQRVLPAPLRERTDAVRRTLGFTAPSRPPSGAAPAAAVLLALGEAAARRRRVQLAYRSWRGQDSIRELDPYGLVLHAGKWYVTGYDHAQAEVRTFRMDRILDVRLGPDSFEPPPDFDAVGQVSRALAAVPYAHEVEVVFATTLDEARRRIPPMVAALSEVDSGVLMLARAERLDGMAQMLAGLGWPFVIRRPDELRDAVRALAARLVEDAAWRPEATPGQ